MQVQRVHIDRFGILSDQDIPQLSPGMSIFLGRNEAGKSTTLQFFKAMLFGYRRGNRSLDPIPHRKGDTVAGGSLFLHTQQSGDLVLTRRPDGRNSQLTLRQDNGNMLTEADFHRLLAGITIDVFDNVFAFNLKNLMDLSSLNGDNVRHALHGAAFGLGMRSPSQVIKLLDSRLEPYLKIDRAGVSALINNCVRELEEIDNELQSRGPDLILYHQLQDALQQADERSTVITQERDILAHRLKRVEQRIQFWPNWHQAGIIKTELEKLSKDLTHPQTGKRINFAPDSIQRLEALLAQKEERRLALVATTDNLQRLEQELAASLPDIELINMHSSLQALREQKESKKNEAQALPNLFAERAELQRLQQEGFAQLGAHWSTESIARADTSLPVQDYVKQMGETLQTLDTTIRVAQQEQSSLADELEQAIQRIQEAEKLVNEHKQPLELPDQSVTDNIMGALAQAKPASSELSALEARKQQNENALTQALEEIDPDWTVGDLANVDTTPEARQMLHSYADELIKAEEGVAQANNTIASATSALEMTENNAAAIYQRLTDHSELPDRDNLELGADALKRLELCHYNLMLTKKRQESANNAISDHVAPIQEKKNGRSPRFSFSSPFLMLSALLLLSAVTLLGLGFFNNQSIQLYCGAGLFVLGLVSFFFGQRFTAPTEHPTINRSASLESLLEARASAKTEVEALEAELGILLHEAAPWLPEELTDIPSEADIAKASSRLDLMRQAHALRERDEQEYESCQPAIQAAQRKVKECIDAAAVAKTVLRNAQGQWQQFMTHLHIPGNTPPRAAMGFFDRVDAAKAYAAAAEEATNAERRAYKICLDCLQLALGSPFFAKHLQQWLSHIAQIKSRPEKNLIPSVLAAIHLEPATIHAGLNAIQSALTELRTMRELEQKQITAQSLLEERLALRTRLETRIQQSAETLKTAQEERTVAKTEWEAWLEQRQLATTLSPEGAAKALELIITLGEREKQIKKIDNQRAILTADLTQFIEEIARYAKIADVRLPETIAFTSHELSGESEAAPLQGTTIVLHRPAEDLLQDVLVLLDILINKTDAAVKANTRRTERLSHKDELISAVKQAQTALAVTDESILSMIQSVNTQSIEEFRALFTRWSQQEALQKELSAVDQKLQALADEEETAPTALIAIFENSGLDVMEKEAAQLTGNIQTLDQQLTELAEERGKLREKQASLTCSEGNAPLRRRQAILKEQLKRYAREWGTLMLAKQLLLDAKSRFEKEGQRGVIGMASKFFETITGGEYTGISASIHDDNFTAIHKNGESLDPEKALSQGTKEQLYLALRLAYIKNHATNAEAIPVIMDDIMVNFDPNRAALTAKVLADFSLTNQVLYFTCHPQTARQLFEAGQHAAVVAGKPQAAPSCFTIERGNIQPMKIAE